MDRKILLLNALFGLGLFGLVNAQAPMRGESDFNATQKAVDMVIIAAEIEQAGYVIDVEEAFDEEGEEGTWVSTDADDIEITVINHEVADLLEMEEGTLEVDDLEESEFVDEFAMEEFVFEDAAQHEEILTEDESDLDDHDIALDEEEVEESTEWWMEDSLDRSWDDSIDEWELEALESSYEEEDMESMEAMYEKG